MRILIATDGSEYSNAAVEECCNFIVIPEGAEIRVMSVFEEAYALAGEPVALSPEFYKELSDAAKDRAAGAARTASGLLQQKLGNVKLDVKEVVCNGPPQIEIVEMAKEWKADLIIVGSHGRGFWGRLLGSVSDAVVHHAPCSVLVVRHGPKQHTSR
jgi:nucleotide-binding universal stress UspA family protein